MIITGVTNPDYRVISQHKVAEVWLNISTNQHSLHSLNNYNRGDVITRFKAGTQQSYPTYLTVQVSADLHITLLPEYLQYVNHCCSPNVFFDISALQLVCLSSIEFGEELRFFYPSAEWELAQPFLCNCGSKNCLQLINGAAHIEDATLKKYRLTEFIMEKIKKEK